MSMAVLHTFTPPESAPLDPGANRTSKPKVRMAEFGDGFSQRAAQGPNNDPWQRSFSWTNLDKDEKDEIDAFFTARNGVESFFYQKHDETEPKVYICVEWKVTDVTYNTYTMSASFQQVFDLG